MNMRYTLNDELVRESLKSVSQHARALYDPKRVVLAGGMANQVYNSDRPHLLRPTTDVDFSAYPTFTRRDFRNFESGAKEKLVRYKPVPKADGRQYEIRVEENGYPFFIHIEPKPTAKYLERVRGWLEATHKNSNEIFSDAVGTKLSIVRPEDIVIGKLRRLGYAESNNLVPEDMKKLFGRVKNRDFAPMPESELLVFLDEVVKDRSVLPSFVDADNSEFRRRSMEYKARKDLYDISLISCKFSQLGFDEKYYESSLKIAGVESR